MTILGISQEKKELMEETQINKYEKENFPVMREDPNLQIQRPHQGLDL